MKRLLLVFLAACATRSSPAPVVPGGAQEPDHEDEILHDLAALDRRIAQRVGFTPQEEDLRRIAMAAVLEEDTTVAVVDGAIDPFSFAARERALTETRAKIALLPKSSESALLGRLVDAEALRLDEERRLPRSASALVRAIVDTWAPPENARELADVDRWLARRLLLVRLSLSDELDVVRARELDDALDALEQLARGLLATTQELVRVRETLEAQASRPAAKPRSDWPVIARRLAIHLGVTASPDELARDLAGLEGELRTRAEDAVRVAGTSVLPEGLEKHMLVTERCADVVAGSPVRSMAAPPERTPSCQLRHFVASADDSASRAMAFAAMHDHVVVAEWALDVARGNMTIATAEGLHHPLFPIAIDARARYERAALARPIATIAAGYTVKLLLADPKARATKWSAIGDVPFDVAAREL